MTNEQLEQKLIVGAKVKVGKQYAKEYNCTDGEVLTLVEGYFDYDNGLWTETQTAPSVWDEKNQDFDSIYHLFENDLSGFMDCEIL